MASYKKDIYNHISTGSNMLNWDQLISRTFWFFTFFFDTGSSHFSHTQTKVVIVTHAMQG